MNPNPTIVALMKKADRKVHSKCVSTVESIIEILKDDGLCYITYILSTRVGVHRQNRGGYGVSGVEVHALGADIVEMGWSHKACLHAVCVEEGPNKAIAKFTAELYEKSPGLAPLQANHIQYGSISCSHTNQFLNVILAELPSEFEVLTVDGKISKTKLATADPKLAEALDRGMQWTVLSHSVEEIYGPELLDLISFANNQAGRVARKDTEIHTLVKAQSLVTEYAATGHVDWGHIEHRLSRRSNMESKDLQVLLKFVQTYGGGPKACSSLTLRGTTKAMCRLAASSRSGHSLHATI